MLDEIGTLKESVALHQRKIGKLEALLAKAEEDARVWQAHLTSAVTPVMPPQFLARPVRRMEDMRASRRSSLKRRRASATCSSGSNRRRPPRPPSWRRSAHSSRFSRRASRRTRRR